MTPDRPDPSIGSAENLEDVSSELSLAYTLSGQTTVSREPISFGRYQVRGVRGTGAFGTVFAAYDAQLEREVAIKVPFAAMQAEEANLFLREARNLARLSHRGILTVFDVGVEDGRCFIVSDLLDGEPLQEWLKGRTITWRETAEIVAHVAEALAHAHERAVVHRDVKPGNIIVTRDRGPVLVDFGLAITDQAQSSEIGVRCGTPAFMSPEQVEGKAHRIDGRTDIYSLSVMLYRMLCHRLPFRAKSMPDLARQILEDEPQPPRQIVPNLPMELERICLKGMAKSVSDRYTTAGDMARDIRGFIDGRAPAALRSERPVESPKAAPSVPRVQRRHLTFLAVSWDAPSRSEDWDVDDEAEMNAAFKRRCAAIATRFGGTILRADGHRMEICYGYPVAQEDASRRAIHTGLEIRTLLTDSPDDSPAVLSGWLSVHTGTVVVRPGDDHTVEVTGEPLDVVQRLETVTDPGHLFVTRDVWRLVSGHFEAEDAGPRTVRGTKEPVDVFRVVRAVTGARSFEAGSVELTPLVGRDQEMGLLFDRWSQTREGRGQAVMLTGDAGLGKSRLVHVLRAHVTVDDTPPLVEWRCSPYHSNSALYPAIDYWERTLGFAPGDTPAGQHDRLKEYLRGFDLPLAETVPLFGSLMGLPEDDEHPAPALAPQRLKELTAELIAAWLAAKASHTPLLFVVEDLHWIDPTTLDLLVSLVDSPLPEPVMLVFTYRPEFTPPWTSRRVTQIALNHLTRSQISEMIRSRAGAAHLPGAFIERVVARTDGVPLFVEELTKSLAEAGRLAEADLASDSVRPLDSAADNWSSVTVPDSLQDLLMARLDRLGGNNVVVQTAAAIGREFGPALLLAACGLPEAELAAELDRLVQAELIYRHGRPPNVSYTFKHALIQDAAYASMIKKDRARVHASIAECLARHFPDVVGREPETQAHHLTEAGRFEEAVASWGLAGSRAVSRSNFPEALAHLTRGVEVLKRLPESQERDRREYRLNVPLGIASLSLRGYSSPELGELYERRYQLCEQMGDDMGRLHAIWASSSWRIVRGEYDIAWDLAQRIIALAEQIDDEGARMEAYFIGQIVAFYRGDLEKATMFGEASVARYDAERCLWHMGRTGQHAGNAALSYLALTQWHRGYPETARRTMAQAVEMARTLDHPFTVCFAGFHASLLNKACRLGSEAQRTSEELVVLAREQAFSFWETTGHLYMAGSFAEQGRHQEARDVLLRSLPIFQAHGAALGLPFFRSYLAEACIGLGQFDEAGAALDSAEAAMAQSNERFHEPEVIRLRAVLATRMGDQAAVMAHLERSIALSRTRGTLAWELRSTLTLAEALDADGRTAEGHDRLAEVYGRFTEGFETPDLVAARAWLTAHER
jgi:serine/threonine protein kinase/tetratricopeptide (TPR) repeat protein